MRTLSASVVLAALLSFVATDVNVGNLKIGVSSLGFATQADARIGRPATPVSAAGVARRTTRRVIRRGAYIATIPANCAFGTYYGYSLYHCGGAYYQRSGGGYVIVYF